MGYQLYEVLLLFCIYSILGWIINVFLFAMQNRGIQNRGVCYGPYLISFGLGALVVLYGTNFLEENFMLSQTVLLGGIFAVGVATGLIMGLSSAVVINGLCGGRVIRLKWYYPVLAGFGALILVLQVNPILVLFITKLPSWIAMVFLLLYWTRLIPELIDGIIEMKNFKKKRTLHKSVE